MSIHYSRYHLRFLQHKDYPDHQSRKKKVLRKVMSVPGKAVRHLRRA